ncbi:DUF6680 family protein [Sphingomonas panaciterrae]|uniref:DUF6680 family protein n=1 Tax=Sphingomonas panaciterrae TaxID=1462999 RepID=UPI002FF229E2
MVAAIAALVIAWRAPKMAAEFAERLRAQNQATEELQRFQMNVFATLMRCRAEILNPEARAAINSVDVAFAAHAEVRDARRLFFEAVSQQPVNSERIIERYHGLIETVARALGLGSIITGFDVRAGYYPTAIGRLDEAALAEAEEKIARRNASEVAKQHR